MQSARRGGRREDMNDILAVFHAPLKNDGQDDDREIILSSRDIRVVFPAFGAEGTTYVEYQNGRIFPVRESVAVVAERLGLVLGTWQKTN